MLTQLPPAHNPIVLLVEECSGQFFQALALGDGSDDLIMPDGDEVEDSSNFSIIYLAHLAVTLVEMLEDLAGAIVRGDVKTVEVGAIA